MGTKSFDFLTLDKSTKRKLAPTSDAVIEEDRPVKINPSRGRSF